MAANQENNVQKNACVIIDNIKWINSEIVLNQAPKWRRGSVNSRRLVVDKKINKNDYIFARLIDGKWKKSTDLSPQLDKIFIKQSYLDKNKEYQDELNNIEPSYLEKELDDDFEDKWINANELLNIVPVWCKGSINSRCLIKNKNIDKKNYMFARKKNNKWHKTDGTSMKFDKVFIRKSHLDNDEDYQEEINNNSNSETESETESENKSETETETYSETKSDNESDSESDSDTKNIMKPKSQSETQLKPKIKIAPPIIELEDHEKFRDVNGNLLEIETRGERNVDKIFFKVKDVSCAFDLKNLYNVLMNTNSLYEYGNDYIYYNTYLFTNNKITNNYKLQTKKVTKKLYLTYDGILRVIYCSNSNKTKAYRKWVTNVVYTAQMGTVKQKKKLVSDILGVAASTVTEVFDVDARTLPCVYLFTLGTVKELRSSMKISNNHPDNHIVAKYGYTNDLKRRTAEHIRHYSDIEGVNLKLKSYTYIDPQFTSKAETDIREHMKNLNASLKYNDEKELVAIGNMKEIVEKYTSIGYKYMGHITELNIKIKDLENTIDKSGMKLDLQIKDKDLVIKDKDLVIKDKDNEITTLRCEIKILSNTLEMMKMKKK
jgi:hypothetical protein